MKALRLGYSPCPNDTFMFNAIASREVTVPGHRVETVLHDVETLNDLAFDSTLDITKLSFYAWLKVKNRYRLLSSGAAMGFGCGPVVIARPGRVNSDPTDARVILPGKWTTAHLLFRLWAPGARSRIFAPYDRIFQMLRCGEADFGVIIHESRFTFESEGFVQVADLGSWWEDKTGLPIPLGGIAAKIELGETVLRQVEAAIKKSIVIANTHPEKTLPYVRKHAQEMDERVLHAHIQTFVNDFSIDLPEQGHRAIATLEALAEKAGVL